ncbi:TPA: hypothetical protein KAV15_002784 [Escherichia coli]|uniref:hypothetical protein n=1 Tax=Escherichia coli TaxID=562 RepID=UPI002998BE9D|nr:hypothetical protein [Escherichia coli]
MKSNGAGAVSLRIPDSEWRAINGTYQISVRFLREKTPQAKRFTQWMQRTLGKLLEAPENVLSCCSSGLINGEIPDKKGWFYAGDALALLTYSIYSSENEPLIDAIELKSGLKLPVVAGASRLEEQFGVELNRLRDFFWSLRPNIHLEITRQKQIGPYRVDFFIVESRYTDFVKGEISKHLFVIEFDEKAHRLERYQTKDRLRDKWLRKNRPDITLIRVRHEEQEIWLSTVRRLKRLARLEDCYAHCLRQACTSHAGPELRIHSDSARKAYDAGQNVCSFLLKRPTQPLREMAQVFERLGIPFEKRRDIYFRRIHLRGYAI